MIALWRGSLRFNQRGGRWPRSFHLRHPRQRGSRRRLTTEPNEHGLNEYAAIAANPRTFSDARTEVTHREFLGTVRRVVRAVRLIWEPDQ